MNSLSDKEILERLRKGINVSSKDIGLPPLQKDNNLNSLSDKEILERLRKGIFISSQDIGLSPLQKDNNYTMTLREDLIF